MFTLSTKCYTFYPCKSIWASFLMLCYVSCIRLIEITKHNITGFPPFLTLLIWTTAMFFFSAWKNELVSSKLRRRRIAYRCFQQGIPPSLAVDVSLSIDDNTYLLATASLTLSIEGGSVRSASQKKSHDFYQQLDALYTALKCPLGNESFEKCLFTWAKPSVPHGMHTHWLLGDEINSGDHLIFKTIIPAKEEVYMNWF